MDGENPSRTNLNFLYTLDAILNSNSSTEAARLTNLSQPAISMALKKARLHFGDELVTDYGGRRTITALGLALRPRVRHLLRDARGILDLKLEFDPATSVRTVKVTMPDFVEVLFLPHVLRSVRAEAPGVDVEVVPFDHWPASRQFEKGVDFALLPETLVEDSHRRTALYPERLAILVAASNPLASAQAITREQFLAGSHAALDRRFDALAPIAGEVADLLAARRIVVRTATYAALPRMIVDTDLIVTTSARYGQYCASLMDLVPFPLPASSPEVEISLQWHPSRDAEPFVGWFRDLLERTAVSSI